MIANLLQHLPDNGPGEVYETLLTSEGVRIERIVSSGQASPPGFWYDQQDHEFVLVVKGNATLSFDDGSQIELVPGSWLHIPPHRRHRVESTSADPKTVWLAIFWKP